MSQSSLQQVNSTRNPPARVLVLGRTGMVGQAWCKLLESESIAYQGLARPEFDLQDHASIDQAFEEDYDLVVNAAAWTDVDGAETHEEAATRANAHAVERVAEHCARSGAFLITYSTDYVFNGESEAPYRIDAAIDPINAYGRSKAMGESLLRDTTPNHLLIRTSWVHAPWGKNFVLTMRSLMSSRDQLQVVDDQRGRPTSAVSLARGSLDLFRAGASGTWHLTDAGECTWFGLASEIRSQLNSHCEVAACTSDAFPRPAKRPGYSTLDLSLTEQLIGDRQPWRQGVRDSLA